jgi:spore photoproduct lyase
MHLYQPGTVYIERRVINSPLARSLRERVESNRIETISSAKKLIRDLESSGTPSAEGKKVLLLAHHKGSFLKPCPGTRAYVCCNYLILNFATNCPMECSYCILQSYLTSPFLVVYANVNDTFKELEDAFRRQPHRFFRVGTGELTDSLALDHLINFTNLAVPFFARQPNAVLELKTKTDNVANLLGLRHAGKTIVAWSLNPQRLIVREERKTASLAARLRAAKICQDAGYPLAFHFDPILRCEGWEEDYACLIEQLFSTVNADRIVWISLGCLRFPPRLKAIIEQRFPHSRITYEEFIHGDDGKLRYFRPLRVKIYSHLVRCIRKFAPHVRLYFCMESERMWDEVLGMRPPDSAHVDALLAQSCIACRLNDAN